ncbi:hypothetical protein PG993_002872 [Apiospora rasikravindrae]|uniref:Integral membrane protein n=1 Tax=Apiospora rasikravindrae TaxID=990691 RepID=A0ABR1TYB1_9PEZI
MASEARYTFYPLTYQSHSISFSKWINLLTLALAPLIAHILAGAPRVSYLSKRRPKWHERFVHYNPTSILWRYAANADRRLRARAWGKAYIAAANAIFWTSDGWDGSEAMVDKSLSYCTYIPDYTQITLFFNEMVKTWIVTLQDAQTVFIPSYFNYAINHTTELVQLGNNVESPRRSSLDSLFRIPPMRFSSQASGIIPRRCDAAESFGLMFLAGYLGNFTEHLFFTATSFSVLIFYVFFLATTTAICAFYFFLAGSASTVIPCITTTWYKAYTVDVMGFAMMTFIFACIETRETFCGRFTSEKGLAGNTRACGAVGQYIIPLGGDDADSFGIAATRPTEPWKVSENNIPALEPEEFLVYSAEGTCLVKSSLSRLRRAEMVETIPLDSEE